jgi:pilus assembly protein Flp/PilA
MDRNQTHAAARTGLSKACKGIARLAARMVREDDAVTAIEYGLLAALIAVTCIVAFQATGTSLTAMYDYWSSAVIAALG